MSSAINACKSYVNFCVTGCKSLLGIQATNDKYTGKMHATAKVNDVVIAETNAYEEVEGNAYFPPDSVKKEYLAKTNTHTTCPWKGVADYWTIKVDGTELKDAAWAYPEPYEKAKHITDYVAFYKSKVTVTKD